MPALSSLGPRTIRLETANYIVRTIEVSDANDDWQHWMEDPIAARNLNELPRSHTKQQLLDYIASFDRTAAHLLGIFEKSATSANGGRLIGMRAMYIDPKHSEFLVNTLIGETEARHKGARKETRDAVFRYFFTELDLQSGRCTALATNTEVLRILDRAGWVCEHKSYKPAASGNGFVEIRNYRLTREVWAETEAQKALARAS